MSVATRANFRRAVMEAAAELFASREEVSMSEIAAAVGIGRATLYRHYESREALLSDLAAFAFADASRALQDAHLADVGVVEAFERAFRALVHVGSRFAVVLRDQVCEPDDATRLALGGQLQALVARGQADGILRGDVPAQWLQSALKGSLLAAVDLAHDIGADDAAAFGAQQFLNGARSH